MAESSTQSIQHSGREIIALVKKGDPGAIQAYKKICNAVELLGQWDPKARSVFLEQILGAGDMLDDSCRVLVKNICNIPWTLVPTELTDRFQKLLYELALRHVSHTEMVFTTCISYFTPQQNFDAKSSVVKCVVPEQDEEHQIVSHSIIAQILRCVPMATKVLARRLKFGFPHFSAPVDKITSYLHNVILVGEYVPQIRAEIWSFIIENMVVFDTMISRIENDSDNVSNTSSGIFVMDEEEPAELWSDQCKERAIKMDKCMKSLFDYISIIHGNEVEDATWLRLGDSCDFFAIMLDCMDNHLLMAVDIHFVPFLWLHLCSFNSSYPSRLLDWLWLRVTRPQRAQSDAKKSHGATAYLSAFLARATYIGIDTAFKWLMRMAEWLVRYVDQCGISQTTLIPGVARHGTFYALSQAFFIVFCFRYKRIIAQPQKWEQIQRCGLGRVVHSALDPLKYVSRPVALCFATISRSLQLVYCNHYLSPHAEEIVKPFEPMFPLDSYKLQCTSFIVSSLMRKFCPLAEDLDALTLELKLKNGMAKEEPVQEMAFLDEEEDMQIGSFCERSSNSGIQSNMFTSYYSTSPGLRNFDLCKNMDM